VSGLAARLLSARPDLAPDQLKALLVAGAVDTGDPRAAEGAGRVDVARSAALPTPAPGTVVQHWEHASPDLRSLARPGRRVGAGRSAQWDGRRWSGRRWSGMKWAGRRWSGASWTG
jgi:hypothetical protein